VIGFDVGDETLTSIGALLAIHKKQLTTNVVHMSTNAVLIFKASVFHGRDLNVSDVFLFNGYTLLLFMTLWLISQSEAVQVFRVVLVHKEDLLAVIPDLLSLPDVRTMSARMGSGNAYPAFSIPTSRDIKLAIAERMSSLAFCSQYPEWGKILTTWIKVKTNPSQFPKSWTVKEKMEELDNYRNDATNRFGPLGHAMDTLQEYLDRARKRRKDDFLFVSTVDRWTYAHLTPTTRSKRPNSQKTQIVELTKENQAQKKIIAQQEKVIEELREKIKRQKK
jgi:hypothetical protein